MIFKYLILICIIIMNLNAFAMEQGISSQAKAGLYNGAITENYINEFMKSNGARQINAEVGRNGIDGLFYKKVNGKMQVYTIESKYNNSQLGDTQNGKQMTKEWKLAKINEKEKSLNKQLKNTTLSKNEINKINKEKNLLQQARKIINTGKDRALLFKMKPLTEELKELNKLKNLSQEQLKRVEYLKKLEQSGKIGKMYKSSILELDSNGKIVGNALKMGLHNKEIDLTKQYKSGSTLHKQQKILKHTIRKENRITKDTQKLKEMESDLKKIDNNSPQYKVKEKQIVVKRQKIETMKNSIPKFTRRASLKTTSKIAGKTAIKAGGKGALKGAAMGILKSLPLVGAVFQVAADAYMMHEIEQNKENIAINSQNIELNSQNIQRLDQEIEILDMKVSNNTYNINKIFENLEINGQRFDSIDNQLIAVSSQIAQLDTLIT